MTFPTFPGFKAKPPWFLPSEANDMLLIEPPPPNEPGAPCVTLAQYLRYSMAVEGGTWSEATQQYRIGANLSPHLVRLKPGRYLHGFILSHDPSDPTHPHEMHYKLQAVDYTPLAVAVTDPGILAVSDSVTLREVSDYADPGMMIARLTDTRAAIIYRDFQGTSSSRTDQDVRLAIVDVTDPLVSTDPVQITVVWDGIIDAGYSPKDFFAQGYPAVTTTDGVAVFPITSLDASLDPEYHYALTVEYDEGTANARINWTGRASANPMRTAISGTGAVPHQSVGWLFALEDRRVLWATVYDTTTSGGTHTYKMDLAVHTVAPVEYPPDGFFEEVGAPVNPVVTLDLGSRAPYRLLRLTSHTFALARQQDGGLDSLQAIFMNAAEDAFTLGAQTTLKALLNSPEDARFAGNSPQGLASLGNSLLGLTVWPGGGSATASGTFASPNGNTYHLDQFEVDMVAVQHDPETDTWRDIESHYDRDNPVIDVPPGADEYWEAESLVWSDEPYDGAMFGVYPMWPTYTTAGKSKWYAQRFEIGCGNDCEPCSLDTLTWGEEVVGNTFAPEYWSGVPSYWQEPGLQYANAPDRILEVGHARLLRIHRVWNTSGAPGGNWLWRLYAQILDLDPVSVGQDNLHDLRVRGTTLLAEANDIDADTWGFQACSYWDCVTNTGENRAVVLYRMGDDLRACLLDTRTNAMGVGVSPTIKADVLVEASTAADALWPLEQATTRLSSTAALFPAGVRASAPHRVLVLTDQGTSVGIQAFTLTPATTPDTSSWSNITRSWRFSLNNALALLQVDTAVGTHAHDAYHLTYDPTAGTLTPAFLGTLSLEDEDALGIHRMSSTHFVALTRNPDDRLTPLTIDVLASPSVAVGTTRSLSSILAPDVVFDVPTVTAFAGLGGDRFLLAVRTVVSGSSGPGNHLTAGGHTVYVNGVGEVEDRTYPTLFTYRPAQGDFMDEAMLSIHDASSYYHELSFTANAVLFAAFEKHGVALSLHGQSTNWMDHNLSEVRIGTLNVCQVP